MVAELLVGRAMLAAALEMPGIFAKMPALAATRTPSATDGAAVERLPWFGPKLVCAGNWERGFGDSLSESPTLSVLRGETKFGEITAPEALLTRCRPRSYAKVLGNLCAAPRSANMEMG